MQELIDKDYKTFQNHELEQLLTIGDIKSRLSEAEKTIKALKEEQETVIHMVRILKKLDDLTNVDLEIIYSIIAPREKPKTPKSKSNTTIKSKSTTKKSK